MKGLTAKKFMTQTPRTDMHLYYKTKNSCICVSKCCLPNKPKPPMSDTLKVSIEQLKQFLIYCTSDKSIFTLQY